MVFISVEAGQRLGFLILADLALEFVEVIGDV